MFHLGPSMHSSTASSLQVSRYGTVYLLMLSCVPVSLHCNVQVSIDGLSSQFRNIQFLSHNLHLLLSVWISVNSVVPSTPTHSTERDKSAPPFGRRRLGATFWALTIWATGRLGAGTNGRRRFGAGRFGAGQQTQVKLPLNKNE